MGMAGGQIVKRDQNIEDTQQAEQQPQNKCMRF